MESLLVPLLILALVGAGVLLGARALGRRGARPRPEAAPSPHATRLNSPAPPRPSSARTSTAASTR